MPRKAPSKPRLRVFLSRRFPAVDFAALAPLCDLRVHASEGPPSRQDYRRALKDTHILISMVEDAVDAALMDAAPGLRLIANFGVGFNNIDVAAATGRGILAANTPEVVAGPTAELAMALLLAVSRRVTEADAYVRSGKWKSWTPSLLESRGLEGKVLGIVGLGGIGAALAQRAQGFGLKVRYWSRRRRAPQEEAAKNVAYRPLSRLLAEADYLSINVALNAETHHLIDAAALARMKPGAFLINTARGEIVDEKALAAALKSGHLGGAGLDVFEREPAVHPALRKMPNVVLHPHLGTSSREGRLALSGRVVENVRAYLAGKKPPFLLNPEAWPKRRR
ncbi:MAG: D-glycerate dehydrogenase [bacterium]|nr:D-glycerate dehydrogenase [bacterium]